MLKIVLLIGIVFVATAQILTKENKLECFNKASDYRKITDTLNFKLELKKILKEDKILLLKTVKEVAYFCKNNRPKNC